jgi:hypothetical protein
MYKAAPFGSGWPWLLIIAKPRPGGTVTKSGREIMEILEAYDLTRCAHSAAQLAGVDEKTVARYVATRERGGDPLARPRRVRSIDPFMARVEEWVEHSKGKIRADVVYQRLMAMGFAGTDRTTRRAVAEVKTDQTLGTLVSCVDTVLRRCGGAPTYLLPENVPCNIFRLLFPVSLCDL